MTSYHNIMEGRRTMNLVLVIILILFHQSQQKSIAAQCRKGFMGPVNVAKSGFCWKFQADNWDEPKAVHRCKRIGGHLVTLDTSAKAKLLDKFIKDSVELTKNGYLGNWLANFYKKHHTTTPWIHLSSVHSTKTKTTWTGTGREVGWGAYTDRKHNMHKPGTTRCTGLHPAVNRWIFMPNCKYRFPSVCEQNTGAAGPANRIPGPKARPHRLTKPPTTTTTTTPPPTTTTTTVAPTTEEEEYEYYDDEYDPDYEYYEDEYYDEYED